MVISIYKIKENASTFIIAYLYMAIYLCNYKPYFYFIKHLPFFN